MRITGIVAVAMLLTAGCGKPAEAPEPPRVTERAKPAATAPARKAGTKADGTGFEFAGSGDAAQAPTIDPKRRLAPSMEEAEARMAADAAEAAVPRTWACGTCGTKAREPGTCCGKDRTPAR